MFIDASALCAILLREPDGPTLAYRIETAPTRLTSPIAIMEAGLALLRLGGKDALVVRAQIQGVLDEASISLIQIGAQEADVALDAYVRYGKGRHPARLNMGDCFAYACARVYGEPLLYKGGDFSLTDIASA